MIIHPPELMIIKTMCSSLKLLDTSLKNQAADFFKLLESKPSPTWTIDSKATTPEYIPEGFVDVAEHWKSICELNRQRLLDSGVTPGELEKIRCSSLNADYWRFEAELYNAEFWKLQQLRQPQIRRWETTKPAHEKLKSSPDDDPISSRLRKRKSRDTKVSKVSSNPLLGSRRRNLSRGAATNPKARRGVKSKIVTTFPEKRIFVSLQRIPPVVYSETNTVICSDSYYLFAYEVPPIALPRDCRTPTLPDGYRYGIAILGRLQGFWNYSVFFSGCRRGGKSFQGKSRHGPVQRDDRIEGLLFSARLEKEQKTCL